MVWPLAYVYDPLMSGMERAYGARWRAELLAELEGQVLEVGAGTGANLAHYPRALERLVLAEPDRAMRRGLEKKLAAAPLEARVELSDLPLEAWPAGESFDAVVCTLVLCSVPDLALATRQLGRLVRPGGRLCFLEHVAADDDPGARAWQERLDPLWRLVAGGCRLARPTEAALEDAGFTFERIERTTLPRAPRIVRNLIRGVARR
jgi:SAM-dependent methyltransferase